MEEVQVLVVEEESFKMYGEFSNVYDLLMWDYDYKEWSNYYKEILKKYSISPYSVLEVGAGTGAMTELLSKSYRDIVAIDPSQEMLTRAREKLFMARNVRFLLQDIRSFVIEKKFDVAIAACDVMNYILTEDDFINSLENVRNSLERGGIFIFDISSYYKLSCLMGDKVIIHDTDDIYYSFQGEFSQEIEEINLNIFIKEGEFFRRYEEYQRMRAYKDLQVLSLIKAAGFKEAKSFSPFTFNPPASKDERMVYLAIN